MFFFWFLLVFTVLTQCYHLWKLLGRYVVIPVLVKWTKLPQQEAIEPFVEFRNQAVIRRHAPVKFPLHTAFWVVHPMLDGLFLYPPGIDVDPLANPLDVQVDEWDVDGVLHPRVPFAEGTCLQVTAIGQNDSRPRLFHGVLVDTQGREVDIWTLKSSIDLTKTGNLFHCEYLDRGLYTSRSFLIDIHDAAVIRDFFNACPVQIDDCFVKELLKHEYM